MNKMIYKYRDWENLIQRRFITNNELFFASPKSLNDPLELMNIFHFELLDYNKKIKFAADTIRNTEYWLSEQVIQEKAKKWVDDDKDNDYKSLKKHGRKLTKDFRKNVGVFSACNTGDNNHLWINYANNYRGFCIGYDFEELREYMSKRGVGGFGGDVSYYDTLPIILPDLDKNLFDLFQLCLTKLRIWEPEDENRFLKFRFVNRKWSIKSSIIKEIIIGQDINEKSKAKLMKYVLRKYHDCKIYIAYKPDILTDKKAKLIEMKK